MTYLYHQDFENNYEYLEQEVTGIDAALTTVKPSDDEWSVVEILEHIYYVEKGAWYLMQGPSSGTRSSSSDKIEEIKSVLLNFDYKSNAPGPAQPKGRFESVSTALMKIKKNRDAILDLLTDEHKYNILDGFEHFKFGKMTSLEWLYMSIYHVERHLHQIHQTVDKLNLSKA